MDSVMSSLSKTIVTLVGRVVQEAEAADRKQRENDRLRGENESLQRRTNKLQSTLERLGDRILKLDAAEKNVRRRLEAELVKRKEAEAEADRLRQALEAALAWQFETEEELAKAKSQLGLNSGNSSRAPSTDSPGVGKKDRKEKSPNEHNTRKRSGKKRGGQPGHEGTTLTEEMVRELIDGGRCRHKIVSVGSGEGEYRTRFVVDTATEVVVTEYRIYTNEDGTKVDLSHWKNPVMYGDTVRASVAQLYALGTLSHSKIHEYIRAQTEDALPIAAGTVYRMVRTMSELAQPTIAELVKELKDAGVVMTDATVVRANQSQAYVRNFSTETIDLLVAMKSKSLEELETIPFLAEYTGTLIHDHETALYHFGTAHGECNVHIDRYLKGIIELTDSSSADEMRSLLYDIKEAVERNEGALSEEECAKYSGQYDQILTQWREENSCRRYEWLRQKELALINRMEKYKDAHLLFMYDKSVPFDNNRSERAVRGSKVHSKVTGGFRSHEGSQMCCSILTIAQTSRLRGVPTMQALRQLSGSEYRASFLPTESPLLYGEYEPTQDNSK